MHPNEGAVALEDMIPDMTHAVQNGSNPSLPATGNGRDFWLELKTTYRKIKDQRVTANNSADRMPR